MARETALSLYQLMGAPLQALVEAESHAAYATAEFIKQVGFSGDGAVKKDSPSVEDFGNLKMVTFKHEKIGADGKPRTIRVEVPLLSLLPIPALQIKDADLDFYVKIVDQPPVTKAREKIEAIDGHGALRGFKEVQPRELMGTIGRAPSETPGRRSLDMQIRVRIRMEQADVPAGLGRLFNLLEHNVATHEE